MLSQQLAYLIQKIKRLFKPVPAKSQQPETPPRRPPQQYGKRRRPVKKIQI